MDADLQKRQTSVIITSMNKAPRPALKNTLYFGLALYAIAVIFIAAIYMSGDMGPTDNRLLIDSLIPIGYSFLFSACLFYLAAKLDTELLRRHQEAEEKFQKANDAIWEDATRLMRRSVHGLSTVDQTKEPDIQVEA